MFYIFTIEHGEAGVDIERAGAGPRVIGAILRNGEIETAQEGIFIGEVIWICQVGVDLLDKAGVLIGLVGEFEVVVADLAAHEEGIGEDLVGAGIGGFGIRRDAPVLLLVAIWIIGRCG